MVYKPPTGTSPDEVAPPTHETVALIVGARRYEITKRRTVIGRSQGTDIRLEDPNVSRRHAEIRREGADYLMVDLGSTNGVEVNGSRV
jgi:pSer/pThr/pTyr-binding forkhead associated (FHA) protein